MKRMSMTLVTISAWACLWLVLAGADRGCFFVGPECADLDEQACLADADCRAVYEQSRDYEDVPCGEVDGVRCIGSEPVFDRCEQRPDCANLDEQACLGEQGCQAIYGYGEDDWLFNGGEEKPRCVPGTRCIMPPETFLECLDADADPCAGLAEQECWQRPMCEAEYSYGGCEGDVCWDGSTYEGCRLIGGECQSDLDCYERPIAFDPGCPDFYFTCEAGQCVTHCDQVACQADSDCAADQRCELRCGNGWCEGVCVAVEEGCFDDSDCQAGEHCVFMPCDCEEDDPDCLEGCLGGAGFCVPDEPVCSSDSDCPAGQVCQFDEWCEDGWCGQGHCVPAQTGCQSDLDCGEGMHCEIYCGNGWCEGVCEADFDCRSDADCAQGETCEIYTCNDEFCLGMCVADHQGCGSDADCAPGERCETTCGNGWCESYCVGGEYECTQDADCAEGQFCEPLPNVDCAVGEPCPGFCQAGTWVYTEPVQCGGNAWELDAQQNPERYYGCMLDCGGTDCGGSTYEEICRVRTYFLSQGILLHDIRDVQTQVDTCMACDCPRGDVIYALVADMDLERILMFGFSIY